MNIAMEVHWLTVVVFGLQLFHKLDTGRSPEQTLCFESCGSNKLT